MFEDTDNITNIPDESGEGLDDFFDADELSDADFGDMFDDEDDAADSAEGFEDGASDLDGEPVIDTNDTDLTDDASLSDEQSDDIFDDADSDFETATADDFDDFDDPDDIADPDEFMEETPNASENNDALVAEFGDLLNLTPEQLDAELQALEGGEHPDAEDSDPDTFTYTDDDSDDSDTESPTASSNPGEADEHGSVVDSSKLLGDDSASTDTTDYTTVSAQSDSFIDSTGEIVVMAPDNEDAFKLVYLDINQLGSSRRIRSSGSVESLVKSIKSTGLLKPIDVAPTSADGYYVVLDGYRRLLACARAGKRKIPCVVNTKISVPDIPILEALYNHNKSYTTKEIVDYIAYLEKEKGIMSASMIEYLLQLNAGDYTKLKDILEDNDDDIVSKLYNGQYNIDTAFKKLEQRRKKESSEEKEVKKASKVYEDAPSNDDGVSMSELSDSGETGDENIALSDEEIENLSISASHLNDDIENMELSEMIEEADSIEGFEPHKQDPNNRERLDPTLRKAVLARDNNTCHVCGLSGMEYTEVLDVHHIVEVYLGGSDAIENLITACTVCHKLVHLYGRGELNIRPMGEMDEAECRKFKKVVHLGKIIRKGMAQRGMKIQELKKMDNANTIGRTKPGTPQVAG